MCDGEGDLVVEQFAMEREKCLRGEAVFETVVAPGEEALLWAAVLADVLDRLVGAQGAGDGEGIVVVALADAFGA